MGGNNSIHDQSLRENSYKKSKVEDWRYNNNIQFPARHKKSVKTDKEQSIISKNFNLLLLPWSRWDALAHQGLKNITRGNKNNHQGKIQKFTED